MTKIELPKQLEELRNQKVWINYVMIWNDAKHNGDGGFDKPPVNPHTLRDGSSTDSSRWATFEEALDQVGKTATIFYKNKEYITAEVSGVGLILEAVGLVGIDFDGIIRRVNGSLAIDKDARDIWKYLDSYTEISPSGSGVHVLAKGKKPSDTVSKIKNQRTLEDGSQVVTEYEMYDHGRYFTFTGRPLKGCDRGLEERQEQIEKVFRLFEVRKEKENARRQSLSPVVTSEIGGSGERAISDETDAELWEKMFRSRSGTEIRRLYDGDLSICGDDHSACDLALCNHLAYWTNLDSARIDRMFRQSGLVREKWTRDYVIPKFGKSYREWTIETALSGKSSYHVYTAEERKRYAQRKEREDLERWEKSHPGGDKFSERARIWQQYKKQK